MTLLFTDPLFLEHETGQHPESPERLRSITRHLTANSLLEQFPKGAIRAATTEELLRVHSETHLERVRYYAANGGGRIEADTVVSPKSYDVALKAAGSACEAVDQVLSKKHRTACCLIRPPGHHAERAMALGFCLFNNVAILARHLQRVHGLDKILIVDWDVHHGNGTQHSFEEDPSVLYVSTHQYPYYPGTGAAYETGSGRGRGATLNCPMPAGATDTAYERAFFEEILPKLAWFKPECVIISAGFDAHRDDPLADVQLSTGCFRWMTERLMEIAADHAGGRLLSVLEGGYNLARLGDCVSAHLERLRAPL